MKISIIIPYKNSSEWLPRCINSLCKNPGDLEFLFINDNSTDNSKDIVEKYSDKRIVMFDNEHNPGVSGARNTGLDHATGDYVNFLDSDDECVDNVFSIYINAINVSKANIIQFNHLRQYVKSGRIKLKYVNAAGEYSTDNMPQVWEFVTNKLFNREFIEKYHIRFNENMQWGEDELFSLSCVAKDNRIRHFDNCNFIHHFNNVNSLAKSKKTNDLLKQVHILEEFLLEQEDSKIRCFVCDWIGFHWTTKIYKTILGVKED